MLFCQTGSVWELNELVVSATALHDTQIAVAVIFLRLQSEGQITSLARRFGEVGEWKGGGGEPEMETGGGRESCRRSC